MPVARLSPIRSESDLHCVRPAKTRPVYARGDRVRISTSSGEIIDDLRGSGEPLVYRHIRCDEAPVEEGESNALAEAIDSEQPDLVACLLLETELRRAAHRDEALTQEAVSNFLDGVGLYELPVSLFKEAGLLPGSNLRSLDALHLAAAVRIGVDRVVAYDARMIEAARELGLSVVTPS